METFLLHDLAIVFMAAAAMSLLCRRLNQPVVIGYLLTGLLIGPYTPPFSLVHDLHSIHTMAELGLVLLMFSLGLEFNLPKLRRVGPSATIAAGLEIVGMIGIGYGIGHLFGWNNIDSLFLGALLSISSTTIIVKVFNDENMSKENFTQVVFGILILEDVAAVVILSILSGLGLQSKTSASAFLMPIARVSFFVILFLVVGLATVPRFLKWVARFRMKELVGVSALGLCFIGAMLAARFQLSIALGAFLAGAVIAASEEISHIEDWVHPIKDMFSVLFFVSAGMLIQPRMLVEHLGAIVVVTVATIIGKVLTAGVGSFFAGYDLKTSVRVGMSLSQIGEFSFVIASLGLTLGVTSDFLYPIAIVVSALTTLATPYLIRNSDFVVAGFISKLPPAAVRAIEQAHEKIVQTKSTKKSSATAILSRYLVRLVLYMTLLIALFLLATAMSSFPVIGMVTLIVAALFALPLSFAMSKYLSHVMLLWVSSVPVLLRAINVHLFYNIVNSLTVSLTYVFFGFVIYFQLPSEKLLFLMGVFLVLISRGLRRSVNRIVEKMESVMDDVVGLATSDPTRQAVMAAGEKKLLLYDVTDQFRITDQSPVVGQTIRGLNLREQTGASIVAIYRDGKHIANPSPDIEFLADDVLILIGEELQLSAAKDKMSHA